MAWRGVSHPSAPSCFEQDVKELSGLIHRFRELAVVSRNDFGEFGVLFKRVQDDLWEETSPLVLALLKFVQPVGEVLEEGLRLAIRELRTTHSERGDLGCVWERAWKAFKSKGEGEYALVDRNLLLEIVKNILTNIRHGCVAGEEMVGELSVRREAAAGGGQNDDETSECIVLSFWNSGRRFDLDILSISVECTLNRHRKELSRYGGELRIMPSDVKGVAEVKMFSRRKQFTSYRREADRR
jgi:hypothetical protein